MAYQNPGLPKTWRSRAWRIVSRLPSVVVIAAGLMAAGALILLAIPIMLATLAAPLRVSLAVEDAINRATRKVTGGRV